MKVYNMKSLRSNRDISNQFIIDCDGERFFQSYKSIIVRVGFSGDVILDENYWNYSRTTAKYRNQFLGETTADIKRKINSGEYKLANLN